MGSSFGSSSPPPPTAQPSIAPSEIVGRWGIASYHREDDRARTEVAARGQCKQPYVISAGSAGGVMMLNHDSPNILEHQIKVGTDGKTYIGPGTNAAGQDDREVVAFDGRTLVLRWVDPEVAGRYGTMVLARCPPEGAAPPPSAAKRKPKAAAAQ